MSAVAVERSELADDRLVPEHLRGTRSVLARGLRAPSSGPVSLSPW